MLSSYRVNSDKPQKPPTPLVVKASFVWNWVGPVGICRFGWRNDYQKTDQRGKACADKEREGFPRTAKFQRPVVLLNLQELIKSRHRVCSLCARPQVKTGINPWLHDWRAAAPTGKVCRIMCACSHWNKWLWGTFWTPAWKVLVPA